MPLPPGAVASRVTVVPVVISVHCTCDGITTWTLHASPISGSRSCASRRGRRGRTPWSVVWLLFAPLVFRAPTAAAFVNDTLAGALVIAFVLLMPGMPGMRMLPGPGRAAGLVVQPLDLAATGPDHRARLRRLLPVAPDGRLPARLHDRSGSRSSIPAPGRCSARNCRGVSRSRMPGWARSPTCSRR